MNQTEAAQLVEIGATPTTTDLSLTINTVMETIKDGNPVYEHDAVKAVCTALGVPADAGGVLNISDAATVKNHQSFSTPRPATPPGKPSRNWARRD